MQLNALLENGNQNGSGRFRRRRDDQGGQGAREVDVAQVEQALPELQSLFQRVVSEFLVHHSNVAFIEKNECF